MSSFDWQSVVDIVEKEFPLYIPVPSRDVEDYRILNFMFLAGETKHSGHPRFYYYGSKGDISPSGPSSLMPNPESSSKKLWSCIERSSDREGSSKDNTFSLGTIKEESKAELNRPKEFGSFPIGFKVGKVRLVEVATGLYNPVYYRLQLEDLRFFNRPYRDLWAKCKASKSAK